jgi:ABC-2 type transport system permease protein
MLWYKAWLDTRGRFVIGAIVLPCAALFMVLAYPQVMGLLPAVSPSVDMTGALGRQIGEAMELLRDYRSYVWSQWFRQTPTNVGALFAALLGTGGLVTSSGGGGAALFTLSLPATRHRLIAVRAASGLAQWFALAFASSLVIPLVSPIVGETYGVGAALVHALCLSVGGSVIYSLALLLSTFFSDLWRPWLITLAATVPIAFAEQMSPDLSRFGLFGVMTGQYFFRTGGLPWLGLLAAAAVSAALLYAAALSFARRDF